MVEDIEKKQDEVLAQGQIYASLERTSKQIKQERGDSIAEDLELTYKRRVEDIRMGLVRLRRTQVGMFDFSPTNTQSLVMIKDLDSQEICEKDLSICLQIRNEEIKLELAENRYKILFGKTI